MKNSIQYFTEKGIPELEKIKINFMETPAMLDKCGRSMSRVRKIIGRKPETELPLILAVLRVLYTSDLLDSIDELAK